MANVEVVLELDTELVEEARRMVGSRGLSAYLEEAFRKQVRRDRRYSDQRSAESSEISDNESSRSS